MTGLQQFKIFKFESGRLLENKKKVTISISEARENGEIISMAESQLIRFIFKLTNRNFSRSALLELVSFRKKLSRAKNSAKNRMSISSVNDEMDSFLFIPEIISIVFDNKSHYTKLFNGVTVNGETFVPLMSSAGMVRRNSSLFVKLSIKSKLLELLDNGRKRNIEVVPAKYSSYFALSSSSSQPVSFPKMVVVPDKIIKTIRKVDYSTFVGVGIDPVIEEREMEIECNAFDGQGLVSPSLAKRWSEEMGLDYTFSTAIVRSAFLKGMVVVFDFHEFADTIADQRYFKDIYGNTIDIFEVECIVTESMFKLWIGYSSTEEYIRKSLDNGFDFAISKVNPKEDKAHAKSSYQFLQILKLDDKDIRELCEPTIDWIMSVSGGSVEESLLYSLGDTEYTEGWFNRLPPTTRAVLLDNTASNDPHIISQEDKSLSRKKNDAKMGRLLFHGNYSSLIADPYAQAAAIFGMDDHLLNDGEHYSRFWNNAGISKVAGIRSPIVHSSECDIFNFKINSDTEAWYANIHSGIVIPANGIGMDCSILGGADSDGDLVCTINNPAFIKGRVAGVPIIYDTKKAPKITSDGEDFEKVLGKSQQDGFGTKIGFYTNVGSSMYALLSDFEDGTPEKKVLLNRLKYFRVLQGLAIDSAKGLLTDPFPDQFVKYKKLTDDMTDDERKSVSFNNSIIADKRPLFMRWLYPHYNKKHTAEMLHYDNVAYTKWRVRFSDLLQLSNPSDEQSALIRKYKRKSFFVDNLSEMNRVSAYVESEISKRNRKRTIRSGAFDHRIYYSGSYTKPSKNDRDKLELLYKEWRSLRRTMEPNNQHSDFRSGEEISRYILGKAYSTISSSSSFLGDLAIYMTYETLKKDSRSFAWSVFGEEIIENMLAKKKERYVRVPQKNPKGTIEYLWGKYSMYLVNIEV